jgi:hypothetical protein
VIHDKLLIAISESRKLRRKSARYPVNAGLGGVSLDFFYYSVEVYICSLPLDKPPDPHSLDRADFKNNT